MSLALTTSIKNFAVYPIQSNSQEKEITAMPVGKEEIKWSPFAEHLKILINVPQNNKELLK